MVYNKLVRDKIPAIIDAQGKKANIRILNDEEYRRALETKLDEEVSEYHKDRNLEELADILEVVYALTESLGHSKEELFEELKQYDAYYVGDKEEKVIYLTFDCGYENGNTEAILDALKKHNAPATFFVVGHFLETAPEITKRMVAEEHTVGNHTYHHPDMSSIADITSFQKELDDTSNLYKEITGQEMAKYYRPPQGKYSTENLEMAKELGYDTFFWSLAYVDWNVDAQPTKDEAFDKLLSRIHPGAIVLLHSTSKTNGEILDELLTKWEEMGYTFKPLSELVAK